MRNVCVFCGSSSGIRPAYAETAAALGRELVRRGLGLVYGGGDVGLMGIVADSVLEAGGDAIGVIPEHLVRREVAHRGLTKLHVVASMHERKALMAELADGFLAMPGGLGTFEELFEVVTWSQLGLHEKPVGLLDVEGFFQPLLALLDHAVGEGFIRPEHRGLVHLHAVPDALLEALAAHRPLGVEKTFDRRRS